jgi:hypothetical protein
MRDVAQLITALKELPGKSASCPSPESCKDPAEAGTKTELGTSPGSSEVKEMTGADPSLEGNPAPETATEPKVGQGDVGTASIAQGEFTVQGAAAKSASEDFQARVNELRQKLANFANTPATPAAVTTPAAPADPSAPPAPATTDKEASDAPVGYFHRVVLTELMKSARGRDLIEDCLNEVIGVEGARKLMKSASAEYEEFETSLLNQRIANFQQAEIEKEAAAAYEATAAHYDALMKSAANDEQRQAISFTSVLLKQAAARYDENPAAANAFRVGVACAEKFAFDMSQGVPPEEAAASMTGGGEPSMEELLQALAELVQSGQIDQAQAEQILQLLQQAGAGGEAMPEGVEPPPPGMEEVPKEAYVKLASAAEEHLGKVVACLS